MHELYSWDTKLDIWHDANIYAEARGTLQPIETVQHVKDDDGNKGLAHISDSGCMKHMSPDLSIFESSPTPCPSRRFRTANKETSDVKRSGTANILLNSNNSLPLPNALYVPEITSTLISIGSLDDAGYTITFGNGQAVIIDPEGKEAGIIPKSEGLYHITQTSTERVYSVIEKVTVEELHRRMGHISPAAAKSMVSGGFIEGVEIEGGKANQCETCIFAKMARKPVPKQRRGEPAKGVGNKSTPMFGDLHHEIQKEENIIL